MLKEKLNTFIEKILKDDLFTQASAIAFYVTFALPPLLFLLLTFLATLQLEFQEQLKMQIADLMGRDAAMVLDVVIDNATKREDLSRRFDMFGFFVLIFSSSVIFAQLQAALNIIFEAPVSIQPEGFWHMSKTFVTRRLVCFGMVLTFVFILIVSLAVSAVLSFIISPSLKVYGDIAQNLANFIVFALLFGAIFKWMPDRKVSHLAALWGGAITAFLFAGGKFLIGLYIGRSAFGSVYGAAGSLAVLLVWVYYSSLILLFGAEISVIFDRIISKRKACA